VARRAFAWLLLLGSAAPAAASAGEGAGALGDLVWPVLNLAILLAALVYFGRRPIRDFFEARHGRIREELDSAARALSEAESRYAEWRRRLAALEAELARIRTQARERAEAEREHLLAGAAAATERVRADARAAVDQELRRAREELRREAAELAIELAAETLRARLTAGDHTRLLDEFIETIERGAGSAAPAGPGA
jgi:F-type H+-transporting ATPase subunit b